MSGVYRYSCIIDREPALGYSTLSNCIQHCRESKS
jgi:hypothetical protein